MGHVVLRRSPSLADVALVVRPGITVALVQVGICELAELDGSTAVRRILSLCLEDPVQR